MSTHLATCPACGGSMDVTDVGPYTRVKCPGCGDEVRVKTVLDGYTLLRRLAIGGMSVVFVARDETLGREVAVKVLAEEYSSDEKRGREFEREAELTAAVSHPNVVRVFTVGRAFERFYIAMELVGGQSLEQRMSEAGALPEKEVIPLALQVVDGLRAAQTAGLIHRDIKPGNILIDEKGTAKIVDFGLSRLTEGGSVKADEIWATPYYVAPEAVDHQEEDFRSDVYALGASLYHALSGKPPVETEEMSTRVLREAKKKVRPLAKIAPWLTEETVAAVQRAMAHDPRQRYGSYEEFRSALEAARASVGATGGEVPVHGAARVHRRRRRKETSKAWVLGGAAVIAVAALATWTIVSLLGPGSGKPSAATGVTPVMAVTPQGAGFDPAAAEEINAAYQGAREALAEDDFLVAEQQFLRVWRHEKSPAQTGAWAAFEAAVAAFLDGRSGDARKHLGNLELYLAEKREAETATGRRLRAASAELRALRFVAPERVPQRLEDPFRATVFFAMALKAWEQGQMDRAAGWFHRLAAAGPWPEGEWMDTYRELARRYEADYQRLQRIDHTLEGKGRDELKETVAAFDELYTVLETRGRARFNVRVWQADAMRSLRTMKQRPPADGWKERRNAALALAREGNFAQASEALKRLVPRGEGEVRQQAGLVALSDAASAFLQDMARVLAAGGEMTVRTRDGGQFDRVVGAQPEGLLVDDGGAARLLTWREIAPASLLAVQAAVRAGLESPFERRRRLEQGAAFARLSGLEAEADRLAARLVEDRPEFAARWREWTGALGGR